MGGVNSAVELRSFVSLQGDDEGEEGKGGPFGKSDDTFVPGKIGAANFVATQQAYEAWKEADVATRDAANIAQTNALKAHVSTARDSQIQGDFHHDLYPRRSLWAGRAEPTFVYIPEEELYLG